MYQRQDPHFSLSLLQSPTVFGVSAVRRTAVPLLYSDHTAAVPPGSDDSDLQSVHAMWKVSLQNVSHSPTVLSVRRFSQILPVLFADLPDVPDLAGRFLFQRRFLNLHLHYLTLLLIQLRRRESSSVLISAQASSTRSIALSGRNRSEI